MRFTNNAVGQRFVPISGRLVNHLELLNSLVFGIPPKQDGIGICAAYILKIYLFNRTNRLHTLKQRYGLQTWFVGAICPHD